MSASYELHNYELSIIGFEQNLTITATDIYEALQLARISKADVSFYYEDGEYKEIY